MISSTFAGTTPCDPAIICLRTRVTNASCLPSRLLWAKLVVAANGIGSHIKTRYQNYAIGETHTFSNNLLNDARFAFIRFGVGSAGYKRRPEYF